MKTQKGFSLIELLIVVAIILIIAAIAIPNLLRARVAANESSAVGNLRTLNTAEVSYITAYPTVGYAGALGNMAGATCPILVPTSTNACLIDITLANATTVAKSGYLLGYTVTASGGTNSSYLIHNDPTAPGSSGVKQFVTDESGVIHVKSGAVAALTDPAI